MKNSVFQFSVSDLHSVKPDLKEVYLNEVYFATQTFYATTKIYNTYKKVLKDLELICNGNQTYLSPMLKLRGKRLRAKSLSTA